MSGSDGRYMSVDTGPSAVMSASSAVSANVSGRSMEMSACRCAWRKAATPVERSVQRSEVRGVAQAGGTGAARVGRAVAMQVRPMHVEPDLGTLHVRALAL